MLKKCEVCGLILDSELIQDRCPKCQADASRFRTLSREETEKVTRSHLTNSLLTELAAAAEHQVRLAEKGIADQLDPGCIQTFEMCIRDRMNTLGIIPWGLSRGLPVLLLLVAGQGVVDTLIKIIPTFIMNGFKFAGGLLPVVGFAILMRYLPVLKKPQFIILGFVLAAYINMPILGIALIGTAAALITYQNATAKLAAGAAQGGDDDYDE